MTIMYHYRQLAYAFLKMLVATAFLLLAAQVLSSCEHKDLCYEHPHRQNVEVVFDWSEAPDANPTCMSFYLYPEDGGAPLRYGLTDRNGGCISVAPGVYDAICMNADKDTHRIKGKEKRETFEITSAETRVLQGFLATMAQSAPRAAETEKERVMMEPEMLWTDHVERIIVKNSGEKTYIRMKPQKRIKRCTVEIRNIENIHGVNAISASVSGWSGGWFAGINELSEEKVTIPFEVNTDVAKSVAMGGFNLFGHCPGAPGKHKLMVYAQLIDGKNWYYEKDVTDQVNDLAQDQNHIRIVLDKLTLPKPAPGVGGGLQPSINKWNEINIEIQM